MVMILEGFCVSDYEILHQYSLILVDNGATLVIH